MRENGLEVFQQVELQPVYCPACNVRGLITNTGSVAISGSTSDPAEGNSTSGAAYIFNYNTLAERALHSFTHSFTHNATYCVGWPARRVRHNHCDRLHWIRLLSHYARANRQSCGTRSRLKNCRRRSFIAPSHNGAHPVTGKHLSRPPRDQRGGL